MIEVRKRSSFRIPAKERDGSPFVEILLSPAMENSFDITSHLREEGEEEERRKKNAACTFSTPHILMELLLRPKIARLLINENRKRGAEEEENSCSAHFSNLWLSSLLTQLHA